MEYITGDQFKQSQQAYEQGVQESKTFEGDAEVCRSRSEGVNVHQVTEYRESFRDFRSEQRKSHFRRHRRVPILYLRRASST